jgi:DNA-binding NarL/FixJ family response regulator
MQDLTPSFPVEAGGSGRGVVDALEGKTSSEIARMTCLSPKSVQTYRSRLMMKLGVSDVPSLVMFALEHGLTPPK